MATTVCSSYTGTGLGCSLLLGVRRRSVPSYTYSQCQWLGWGMRRRLLVSWSNTQKSNGTDIDSVSVSFSWVLPHTLLFDVHVHQSGRKEPCYRITEVRTQSGMLAITSAFCVHYWVEKRRVHIQRRARHNCIQTFIKICEFYAV